MLSVSVVLSVPVERAVECQVRVSDVSLSDTVRSLRITVQKKSRFGRQRKPSACGPKHCTLRLERPMVVCPRSVIHAGQKCGAARSAPSGADSSPVGRLHITSFAGQCSHVLLEAAATALDARCLQTFANTGDCTV